MDVKLNEVKMFHIKGSKQTFKTARDCAVFHFGTEAVVSMPFDIWMSMATGATVVIEPAT